MLSLEPFKGYVTTPGYAMHSEITEILPVSTDAWMYSFFNRNMTNSRDMMMKNIYLIVFKEIYIINCSMFLECSFFLLVSIPLPSISIDQLLQLFPILILLDSIIRKKKNWGIICKPYMALRSNLEQILSLAELRSDLLPSY